MFLILLSKHSFFFKIEKPVILFSVLTLSRRKSLSYRNESIDLLRKSMDWFLYDNGLRLERVKWLLSNEICTNKNLSKLCFIILYGVLVKVVDVQFIESIMVNCSTMNNNSCNNQIKFKLN